MLVQDEARVEEDAEPLPPVPHFTEFHWNADMVGAEVVGLRLELAAFSKNMEAKFNALGMAMMTELAELKKAVASGAAGAVSGAWKD